MAPISPSAVLVHRIGAYLSLSKFRSLPYPYSPECVEGDFSEIRYFSSVLSLVASVASGVREGRALRSYEPPLIALRVEG